MIQRKTRLKRSTKPIRKVSKRKSLRQLPWMGDPRSRVFADGRQELRGKDKAYRRLEIFLRADGKCEEIIYCKLPGCQPAIAYHNWRCHNVPTEWSHIQCKHSKVGSGHGRGFKCDALECGIASCKACHERRHGGI